MKPVKTISPENWMCRSETIKVMNVLNNGGEGEGNALFVGGCVRNTLLKKPVSDIDIATKLHPQEVQARLKNAGIKSIPTGIEHGTITAVVDGAEGHKGYEITTLRKDVATDGRRATIAFAKTWEDDAQRRDFTMNTLLADCEGNIYDPLGQGLKDLEARHVVFVGDPEIRIAEDILRILRFFRFHGYYGRGDPDDAALKACAHAADKIPELSKERITQEFLKILALDTNVNNSVDKPQYNPEHNQMHNPVYILGIMFGCGVLKSFLFDETDLAALERFCTQQEKASAVSIPARLYMLAGGIKTNVEHMETLLILSKTVKKQIETYDKVEAAHLCIDEDSVKAALYHHGRDAVIQKILMKTAYDNMDIDAPLFDIAQNWIIPTFPISGEDLVKEGYKPGPDLGKELKRREKIWIENGFS